MPSQGVFSNTPVPSGSINILYQSINGQHHIQAITVSDIDLTNDDISLSLGELEYITLPISSSGNLSKLNILSRIKKAGYHFLDVQDLVINTSANSTSASIAVTPYLTETFFYNNYNALLSNAETAETSYLRYDVDRAGGSIQPVNFNALAGFGSVVKSDMYYANQYNEPQEFKEVITYTNGSYIAPLTSSVDNFINNRDVEIRILLPEIEALLGVPQVPVISVRDGAYNQPSYYLSTTSSFSIEIDDNANFDNSNGHFYSSSIATQYYVNGTINYTYSPVKHFISSGSFTSGLVYMKLRQSNRVLGAQNYNEQINVRSFMTSNTKTKNFLQIGLYYSDQQPYAPFAPVQDSNYTTTGIVNARYAGSKTGEDDFSGISPALAAKPLEAALYREDENNQFICSQSLSDRDIIPLLFEGPTEYPSASLQPIGYVNTPVSSSSQETIYIQGLRNRQPQAGDIIKIQSELMQVLTVTSLPSINKLPYYDLFVNRAINGSSATTHNAGTIINRYSGDRVLTLDKNRLIAVSNKKVWIKENRNIVKTNDRGFVIEVSEVCTV